jgi:hypothetical protein
MNRCNKTGLTDKDFKTILDVLNVYNPNDIMDHIPSMSTPEFMQDVQSAFKAVLAHVNQNKYNSDLGALAGDAKRYADDDLSRTGVDQHKHMRDLAMANNDSNDADLDDMDYAEADHQRAREDQHKHMRDLAHVQYIHGLS